MDVFEAIADPTRRRIIELVSAGELSAGTIAREFDVSRPAISKHLRVLREAGLVNSRGLAQKRLYRVDQTALDEIDRWLEKTREFWSARLDALDHHLKGGSR